MSFPKKGKSFPGNGVNGGGSQSSETRFATEIAAALKRSLGSTHAAVKTAAVWTGAHERTAKNWFSGLYGPSGEHLVALARNSDEVLHAFLGMAGRPDLIAVVKLAHLEYAAEDLLATIRQMNGRTM
jgi:selenocysteine lyase/cysteine desulfurase